MRRKIISILLAIPLVFTLAACGNESTGETSAQSASTEPAEPQASDQVGQLLSVAEANLELEGFAVESVTDSGKSIFKKGNWTVIEQKQNEKTVLLTVTKVKEGTDDEESGESAEPAEENPASEQKPATEASETNTQGLDSYGAIHACGDVWETGLKNDYPASKVKVHTMMGILAARLDDADTWFVKIEASVDNNTLNVECNVTGSLDQPQVVPLAVY